MTKQKFTKKFWEIWYRGLNSADYDNPKRTGPIIPGKTPRQNPDEFLEYLWIVSEIQNPVVLEIGKGHGQTEKFYRGLLKAKDYISVDWKDYFKPTICGDSTSRETILLVKNKLFKYGWQVDILFIDGDHHEETVMLDYENYLPLVKSGGYIGFHDIHRIYSKTGATKVWNQVKNKHKDFWDIHYHIDWLKKPGKDDSVNYEQIGIGVVKI